VQIFIFNLSRFLIALILVFIFFTPSIIAQFAQEAGTRPRRIKTLRDKTIKPITSKEIFEAKEKLSALGFWLTKDPDSYRQAIIAFQKVTDVKRSGKLTRIDFEAIQNASEFAPKEIQKLEENQLRVEVDLRRQILFVINHENKILRILTISSGNDKEFDSEGFVRDAVTPVGRFKVYNKIKGWRKSALGLLYYPNYFLSGLAIHGSKFVPPYPDSHGCIRIPMFAAEEFYKLAEMGTEIRVYESDAPVGADVIEKYK
jgi:lipoprotein-anchoring transpeptidase ErfK/SrfK